MPGSVSQIGIGRAHLFQRVGRPEVFLPTYLLLLDICPTCDKPSLICDLELVKGKQPPNIELLRLRFRTLVVY